MRASVLIVVCLILAGALAASRPALSLEMVESINANPSSTWKAHMSPRFNKLTMSEVKSMLTNLPSKRSTAPLKTYAAPRSLPAVFDARQEWPSCVGGVKEQGDCGAGWAIQAASVLSDRYCIATNGQVRISLSGQDILACDFADAGCDGGYLNTAWQHLFLNGAVEESCFPYTSDNGEVPSCRSTCADGGSYKRYRALTNYQLVGEATIQNEIFQNGPVEAMINVYEDLVTYKSGVYTHQNGSYIGDQAVKIVGWGEDYWLVQNSWGTDFGEQGYIRISRTDTKVDIQDMVFAGQPATNQLLKKSKSRK